MLQVFCARCQVKYKVKPEQAGHLVKCAKCGMKLRVPQAQAAAPAATGSTAAVGAEPPVARIVEESVPAVAVRASGAPESVLMAVVDDAAPAAKAMELAQPAPLEDAPAALNALEGLDPGQGLAVGAAVGAQATQEPGIDVPSAPSAEDDGGGFELSALKAPPPEAAPPQGPSQSLWSVIPFKIKLALGGGLVAAVAVVAAVFMLGDSWERDHAEQLRLMHVEAQAAAGAGRHDEAIEKWKQLSALVGDRTLRDRKLITLVREAQDGRELALAFQIEKQRGPELAKAIKAATGAVEKGSFREALDAADAVEREIASAPRETPGLAKLRQAAAGQREKVYEAWRAEMLQEVERLLAETRDGADDARYEVARQRGADIERRLAEGPQEVREAPLARLTQVRAELATLEVTHKEKLALMEKQRREVEMARAAEEAKRQAEIERIKALPIPITVENASAMFIAKHGEAFAKAKASPEPADDVELAKALLASAGTDLTPMAPVMLEHVVLLGSGIPEGLGLAVQAADQLERARPALRLHWRAEAARLSREQWEKNAPGAPTALHVAERYIKLGDALMAEEQPEPAKKAFSDALAAARKAPDGPLKLIGQRLEEARLAIEKEHKLAALLAQLEKSPDDQRLLHLMARLFLYEKDDPVKAQPYIARLTAEYEAVVPQPAAPEPVQAKPGEAPPPEGKGKPVKVTIEELKAHVELAVKTLDALAEDELLKLGRFYLKLADDPTHPARTKMYVRVKLYLEQWLIRHSARDNARVKVALDKRRAEVALSELGVGIKLAQRLVKKLRGVDPTLAERPEIQRAIDKAVVWLMQQHNEQTHWESAEKSAGHKKGGYTALVAYALMMAEQDPRENIPLRKAIDWLFAQDMTGVYSVCFRAHLWETLPRAPAYDKVARADLRELLAGRNKDGSFGYHLKPGANYDVSTTLAGWLSFWLGETNGVKAGNTPWARVCETLVKTQSADGGWAYAPNHPAGVRASMTAAGLTVLLMAIDLNQLEEGTTLKKQVQASIELGLQWMDANFDPARNLGGGHRNYYLAAVQHVGLLTGRTHFNKRNWYLDGAAALVKSQASDGSWGADLAETAFAVAFLSRGGNAYDASGDASAASSSAAAQ